MSQYINKLNRGDYLDNADLWEVFDEVAEALGDNELLNALAKAMGSDELRDLLAYVIQCYDLADAEEEEEEEEENL